MRPTRRSAAAGEAAGSPTDKKTLLPPPPGPRHNSTVVCSTSPRRHPLRVTTWPIGITPESIARFSIGFSPPEWDWLLRRSHASGIPGRSLEAAGLVRERPSGGGHYDFFRGRVMFPIRDVRDRPIAFGGRVLPQLARDPDDAKVLQFTRNAPFLQEQPALRVGFGQR